MSHSAASRACQTWNTGVLNEHAEGVTQLCYTIYTTVLRLMPFFLPVWQGPARPWGEVVLPRIRAWPCAAVDGNHGIGSPNSVVPGKWGLIACDHAACASERVGVAEQRALPGHAHAQASEHFHVTSCESAAVHGSGGHHVCAQRSRKCHSVARSKAEFAASGQAASGSSPRPHHNSAITSGCSMWSSRTAA